jgi:uncharacterized protein YuzE
MKITYDSEADALYIELREATPSHGQDIEPGVLVDLDHEGHVIGFEILDASKRLTKEELSQVSYENLVSEKKAKLALP